ncbi:MAG: aspartate ammonia-lyase, partial [Halieaceae bacterium]|nr:aspartate ammonia-lyase [Halieaceae bacterium]
NVNEVIANRAGVALGGGKGAGRVHPNDHVNKGQSSNDVFPSAVQIALALGTTRQLLPEMRALAQALHALADRTFEDVKTGRTHLMDALPITFGQEMGAWAYQLEECQDRLEALQPRLRALPIGGSAVGTGVNVPAGFAEEVVAALSQQLVSQFTASVNPFSRMAGQDCAVECSACLRAVAHVLVKINTDLRWMSSGPLAGLAEIQLQALQPGSSIMPGKVNPILPEAALMAATEVIGNDATIAMAARSGNFQLNVMLPLVADKLLGSIALLAGACDATASAVAGFTVNHEHLQANLARNPILVTALNARIGYDAAAAIAKRAYSEQRPIIEVAEEDTDISRAELLSLLDPARLTGFNRESG